MKLPLPFLSRSFDLNLGKMSLPVAYWEAGAVIFLLFILVLLMAKFRRHYVDWSLKGGIVGIFFGFLFALVLEGFLIIGGRTAITEVMGWKNAPKPLQLALDSGRSKLIQVLGIQDQIPSTMASENATVQSAIQTFQSLNPADMKKAKSLICAP
jgi:hypothetical protein